MLKLAHQKGVHSFQIFGDSTFVINHLQGSTRISCLSLVSFALQIPNILPLFQLEFHLVYKEYNMEANHLSKNGLELCLGHYELNFQDIGPKVATSRTLHNF